MTIAVDTDIESPPTASRSRDRVDRSGRNVPALVGLAVLPLVVSMVSIVVNRPHIDWSGDQALTELAVREAARGHQLVGMGGRFGWSHPGPVWLYALTPVYEFFGRSPWALGVSAILLHVVLIAVVVGAAWRAAGLRGAAVMSALITAYLQATGLAYWTNPWAGYAFTWPLLVLLVVAAIATSDVDAHWVVPATALIGTYLVQTDVSTLVPVLIIAGTAVGIRAVRFGLRRTISTEPPPHADRVLGPIGRRGLTLWVLLVVAWIPPAIQQFTRNPGNFTLLWRFARAGAGGYPLRTAMGAVGAALTVLPFGARWVLRNGVETDLGPGPWWAVAVVVLAVAATVGTAIIGWRRGRRLAGDLAALTAAGIVAAVVSITRVDGEINFYLLTWVTILPITAVASIVLAFAPDPPEDKSLRADRWALAATAVAVVLAAVVVVTQGTTFNWDHAGSSQVAAQVTLFDRVVGSAHGEIVQLHIVTADTWTDAAGLGLQLERQGGRIEVDPNWVFQFGSAFAPKKQGPDVELWFARPHEQPLVTSQRDVVDLGRVAGVDLYFRRG